MDTNELSRVWSAFQNMHDEDRLEDRREYDADQLSKMYGLSEQGGIELADLIRGHFEQGPSWYTSSPTTKLGEVVTESLHQNYDGWPDWKKVIIEQYLNDLSVGARHINDAGQPDS